MRDATGTSRAIDNRSMDVVACPVFTIGHSTHPLEAFVALLRRYEAAKVTDVRSTPYSRFNPQFNRESLVRNLTAHGIEYAFLGGGVRRPVG